MDFEQTSLARVAGEGSLAVPDDVVACSVVAGIVVGDAIVVVVASGRHTAAEDLGCRQTCRFTDDYTLLVLECNVLDLHQKSDVRRSRPNFHSARLSLSDAMYEFLLPIDPIGLSVQGRPNASLSAAEQTLGLDDLMVLSQIWCYASLVTQLTASQLKILPY
jgi:hypothetical protein